MITKSICWVPYHTAELHPNGYVSPCCKISYQDNTSPYKFDISKFYSEESKQWRKEKFEHSTLQDLCRQCKVPSGVFSYQKMNEKTYKDLWKFPEPTSENASIRKLIIGTDNICASSCISCHPKSSTTINNLIDKSANPEILNKFYDNYLPGLIQVDLDQLDNNIYDLEVIHLYGGEPLFSPNFIKLLEKLKKYAPKLSAITMSTGLCKIKEGHVDYLAEMPVKTNRIMVSVDGPPELNHWIRDVSPDEFNKNINLIANKKDKIVIGGAQTTIGIYNVFALPEFVDFFCKTFTRKITNATMINIVPAVVTTPAELHPKQLPDDIKKLTLKKLRNFLQTSKHHASHREIIKTAIFALEQPATHPWDRCLELLELYPKLRGSSATFDYWIKKYL